LLDIPTIVVPNCTATLLNHLYSNDTQNSLCPGVLSYNISDHLSTFALIENMKTPKSPPFYKRCFTQFGANSFLIDLEHKLRINYEWDATDTNYKLKMSKKERKVSLKP